MILKRAHWEVSWHRRARSPRLRKPWLRRCVWPNALLLLGGARLALTWPLPAPVVSRTVGVQSWVFRVACPHSSAAPARAFSNAALPSPSLTAERVVCTACCCASSSSFRPSQRLHGALQTVTAAEAWADFDHIINVILFSSTEAPFALSSASPRAWKHLYLASSTSIMTVLFTSFPR